MIYVVTQKTVLISPPLEENKTAAILPPYMICPFLHFAKNLWRDSSDIGGMEKLTLVQVPHQKNKRLDKAPQEFLIN
jgi:hypothetical protein